MVIRGKTISYSSYKNKVVSTKECELALQIEQLEKNLHESNKELLDQLNSELSDTKLKGHIIRSRSQWI